MKSHLSFKKIAVGAAMLLLVLAIVAALTLAFLPAPNATEGGALDGSGGSLETGDAGIDTGSDVETGSGGNGSSGGDFEIDKPTVNAGTMSIVYLSGAGNDQNSGSSTDAPVATVEKALQLIASGNSVIYVMGTVRFTADIVVDMNPANYGSAKFMRHSTFGGTLFSVDSGNVTLKNTIIDGGTLEGYLSNTGALIDVTGGTLNLESGTKLQYNTKVSADNNYGGAISISGAANVNIGDGVTILNNSAASGGAIWVNHAQAAVTIDGALFSSNSAHTDNGGALLISAGTVRFLSGTFENNTAPKLGGAVLVSGGTFEMADGSFNNNTTTVYNSGYGGGALASDSAASVIDIKGGTFDGNVTDGSGGAIKVGAIKTIAIANAVFNANGAGRNSTDWADSGFEGGAIHQSAGNLSVENTTFTGNYAAVGGAIRYGNSSGTLTLNGTNQEKAVFRGNILKNFSRPYQYYGIDIISNAANTVITGYRFENSAASVSRTGQNDNTDSTYWSSVVQQTNNSLLTVDNCQFVGDNAFGGVQIQDGHLNMSNATLSGFRQNLGAALILGGSETNTITGCTIGGDGLTGNYRNGIGIRTYANDTVVNLIKTTITNNTSNGIYVGNAGTNTVIENSKIRNNLNVGVMIGGSNSVLTLRGAETEIRDNAASSAEYSGNIRLYKIGSYIRVDGALAADARVDFSLTEALAKNSVALLKIATVIDADTYPKFTFLPKLNDGADGNLKVTVSSAEADEYKVYTYQGHLKVMLGNVYVSANGNDETGDGTSAFPLKTLTAALDYLNPNGTIYMLSHLTVDYEVSLDNLTLKENYTITVAKGGHIKLKNVTYSRSGDYINNTRLFYVNGGTLDLSGYLRFDWPRYAENASIDGFIFVNSGVCNLFSGASFTTASSSSNGGSSSWIRVSGTGVLNVYEGAALPVIGKSTWRNGTALYSVFINGNGTMNMYGGSWRNGGSYDGTHTVYGVRVDSGATFHMSGGELSGAASAVQAIGVWVNGGTFNMSGGIIKDNSTSDAGASGVRVTSGVFNISGTAQVISGTKPTEIPVGVSGNNGTIHINGDLDASAKIELFPDVLDESGSVIVINDNHYNVSIDNFVKANGYNGTWQLDDSKSLRAAYEELAEVFVWTSGNDQWSGVRTSPVRTLARAMQLVKAGGTIYLINTYTLTTASEILSKTVTYNNTTVTKEGVTIKAYSTFAANAEMINSDGKTLSIDGINLDGNNRYLDIYIGNNGNFTLKNATVTGFNRNQTFVWDNVTWGYGLFRVRQNSNLTLDNVVVKGNNIRTLIGAANWATITLHDVDMSDNTVIEDRSIYLAHWTGATNQCLFNVGGRVVMHAKGLEYDTVHTNATQGVVTVDKSLDADSKIIVKSINPFAHDRLVAETAGNGISAFGSSFSLLAPKPYTFTEFDGNGKLYAPMSVFTLDEVYLDVLNGNDQNSGANAALAVKTWDRVKQVVNENGTVYLVRTFTADGGILDRETIDDGGKNITVKAASSFTGTYLFDIPSGKYLNFQNITVAGGAYPINVQSGGTIRFRAGTVLQSFTGSTAVQTAGVTIIDRFDVSAVGLSAGKAVLTVTGGELSVNAGEYSDPSKKLIGIAVSGGTVNLNGGNVSGFQRVLSVSGDGTVNVVSGNYTNIGNGDNGSFAAISGGFVNQYGGTVSSPNGTPVYLTDGGTYKMHGGKIEIGNGEGSVILAEAGTSVAISNGTLSAGKGFIVTANGAITLTVSGAPALSGLFSLQSSLDAKDYTGGIALQITRADTIVSKTTVVVENNTDPSKFALVNADGSESAFTLRAKNTSLVAYSVWTVTFDLNGGQYDGGDAAPSSRQYYDGDAYNRTAALPDSSKMTRLGYDFGGWAIDGADGKIVSDETAVTASHKLTAVWNARSDTKYKVEYYRQKPTADGYTRFETENLQGTTEETVTPPGDYTVKYDGFSFNESYSGNVLSAKLAADGNTVLKVYYDRKSYRITVDVNDGKGTTQVLEALYGAAVVAPVLTREGYEFGGYYKDAGFKEPYNFDVMPMTNPTVYVKWNANTYVLSFNLVGGSYSGSLTKQVVFDQPVTGLVTDPSLITKRGYEFQYWTVDGVRFDNGSVWKYSSSKVAVAVWKPSGKTAYLVEHYLEGVDGAFRLDYTESKFGMTDSTVKASERVYNGFGFDETQQNVTEGTITADGNLVLKLYYKRNVHTVTFETFGGGTLDSIEVKYGVLIPPVTKALQKTGYTLSGWYTGTMKDNVWNFNSDAMPDSDLVLRASWNENRYQVVYSGNGYDGGMEMADQSFTYDGGAKSLIPNTFTRTGYRFIGWSRTVSGEAEFVDGQSVSNLTAVNGGIVTLYAVWNANQYTVVFNKNDVLATGEMEDMAFEYGTNQKLTANAFKKSGYLFMGWSLQSTGSVRYNDGDFAGNLTTEHNTRVILYAKWQASDSTGYKILFYQQNADDNKYTLAQTLAGKGSTDTETSYRNDSIFGSAFRYNENLSVSTGLITADGKLELKLYYDRVKYIVTYETNGGNEIAQISMKNGAAMKAPTNPTKTGYVFLHWYIDENEPDNAYRFDKMPEKDLTLYAAWEANVFYIAFHGNGSTFGAMENLPVTYQATGGTALSTNVFERTGYAFTGWNTQANGGGTAYADAANVANNLLEKNGEILNLYAQWTIREFTVTYDAAEGSPTPEKATQNFATKLTKPSDPVKTGYTFDGWYTKSGQKWSFATDTVPGEDITLTARYSVKNYRIYWYLNGGSYEGSLPETYTIESEEFTLPTTGLAKTGNDFTEWRLNAIEGGSKVVSISKGSTGDLYLYAVWTPRQYTMSFETYGGSSIASVTSDYASHIDKPVDPVKAGYEFGGWYKSVSDGNGGYTLDPDWNSPWDFAADTVPQPGMTLHAKWDAKIYTLTYELSGGAFEGENPYPTTYKITDGEIAFDNATVPTRVGYRFLGWNPQKIESGSFGNKTVAAQWELMSYTVNFETNGGSEVLSLSVNYGALIPEPAVPTRTGYRFVDWYKEANFATVWDFGADQMPAGEITLYAKWTKESFTISFDANGGSLVPAMTVEFETATVAPVSPNKLGYLFEGWYTDETLTTKHVFGNMPAANFTLYAKWNIETYTISYELDGGSFPVQNPNPTTYTVEDGFDILGTPVGKVGYTFTGWSPAAIETGTVGNLTVTALWEANRYVVSFDLSGGTGDASPISVYYDQKVGTLPAPVRSGYSFKGWYDGDVLYTRDTVWKGTSSKTLVAKWDASSVGYTVEFYLENAEDGEYSLTADTLHLTGNTDTEVSAPSGYETKYANFTVNSTMSTVTGVVKGDGSLVLKVYYSRNVFGISFDTDGGSGVAAFANVKYGAKISAPNAPTKKGYRFVQWEKSGLEFIFTTMPGENLSLKAKWEIINYTVQYHLNGGTVASGASLAEIYTVNDTVTLPNLTRENYEFGGWFDNADYAGDSVVRIGLGSVGNREFFAKWTIGSATIGFDSNGGTAVSAIKKSIGDAVEKPADPTKEGYDFGGWFEDNGFFEMEYIFDKMPQDGIMLYAKWIAHSYTVSFDANTGSGTAIADLPMVYGNEKNLPLANYQKTGYSFAGWNRAKDGSGAAFADGAAIINLTAEQNGTVTLYAQWTANEYIVRYHKNAATATGSTEDSNAAYDSSFAFAENGYSRVGYAFQGWNTAQDGKGTHYADRASVVNLTAEKDGTVNLYAEWKAVEYDLTFDSDGGTVVAGIKVTFDAKIGTLPVPTKKGYDFDAWTVDGKEVTEETVWSFAANKQAVAKWSAKTDTVYKIAYYGQNVTGAEYSLIEEVELRGETGTEAVAENFEGRYTGFSYQANGSVIQAVIAGDGSTELRVCYDRVVSKLSYVDVSGKTKVIAEGRFGLSVTAPTVSKTGYTFHNFYDSVTHETFDFSMGIPAKDTVLELNLTPNSYIVKFDKNDEKAIGKTSDESFVYDAAAKALNANGYLKTGYTFVGWNEAADGTGKSYRDGETVQNVTAEADGIVILYAVWRANQYTLTFMDEANTISEKTVTYGEKIGEMPTASKTGYRFRAWSVGGTDATPDTVWEFTENTVAEAQWTAQNYDIEFVSAVSNYTNPNKTTFTFDDMSVTLKDAQKTGYTFQGWYSDDLFNNKITFFATDVEGKTVYAKWSLNAPTAEITEDAFTKVYVFGTSYTINASATHTAASGITYTYQWLKDGTPIANAANAAYVIGFVKDSGTYSVRITAHDASANLESVAVTSAEKVFTITKAEAVKAVLKSDTLVYDGTTKTADITANDLYTVSGNTAIAAGENYSAVISLKDKDNYRWKGEISSEDYTLAWKIARADYDMKGITFDGITVEYDGQAHRPEVKGTLPTGKDGIQVSVSYDKTATNVSEGKVTVTATFTTESANYNVPTAMTATVEIAAKEVTIEWAEDNFTYNGLDQKDNVTAKYANVDGEKIALNVTLTEEGTFKDYQENGYGFTAAFANGETNYKLPSEKVKTYHVKKATLTDASEGYSAAYDGKAHGITVSATGFKNGETIQTENGSIQYSIDNSAWGSTAVTVTNVADSKMVYYKAEFLNYETVSGSKTVTVTPKQMTVSVTANGGVYNGSPIGATETHGGDLEKDNVTVSLFYKGREGTEYEESGTAPTNAGKYTVTARITDGNYTLEGQTVSVNYAIDKATVQNAVLNDDRVYNAEAQTANLAQNDLYTIDCQAQIDAGNNYTAEVSLKDTANYKWATPSDDGESAPITYLWNIKKAKLTDTSEGYSAAYDGKAHGITVSVTGFVSGETFADLASVSYGISDAYENGAMPILKKDVTNGAVTVYYRAEFANYETVVGTQTIEIEKRTIQVSVTPNGGVFGQTITAANAVVSGQAEGETVAVTLTYGGKTYGGESYSSTEVPTKAGAYKVTPSISDGNYTFEEATYDFVVEKQSVEKPSLEADDLIYNGIEQKAKLAESDRYGITGNVNTAANADGAFYTATVTLNETANYKWSGDTDTTVPEQLEYQWRIAKAQLAVEVSVTDAVYNGEQWVKTWTAAANGDGISGLVNNERFEGAVRTSSKDAKTYAYNGTNGGETTDFLFENISVKSGDNDVSANYKISYTLSVKIDPHKIAVKWSEDSFVYNGKSQVPTAAFATALFKEDSATILYTDTDSNIDAATGYSVTASSENPNYLITDETKTKIYSIAAKEVHLEWDSSKVSFIYNGLTQTPSLTGIAEGTVNVYIYDGENGEKLIVTVTGGQIDAGNSLSAEATLTSVTNGQNKLSNYVVTGNQTSYSIQKKQITYVWSYAADGYVYTGKPVGPSGSVSVEGVNGESLQFELNELKTNVGKDYKRTAVFVAVSGGQANKDNYEVVGLESEAYEIKNADLTEITVQGYEGTYGGAEHEAVVGTPTAKAVNDQTVTWKYKTAADGVYTEEMPRFTNADEYTVYYEITAPNHNTAEGQFTVTIARADYDMKGITFDGLTVEYDGQAHRPEVKGTLPTGKDGIQVSVSYDKTATNVSEGKVTVTATFTTESANYNVPTAMTATVEIAAKEVTIEWAEDNFTYNGLDQKDNVTAKYANLDGEKIALNITLTKEGTFKDYQENGYGFTAAFANGETNYKLPSETAKTYHVKKATLTDASEGYSAAYDGEAHGITVSATGFVQNEAFDGLASISYGISDAYENGAMPILKKDVTNGALTVYYRAEFANYETVIGTQTIQIEKRVISINVTPNGGVFGQTITAANAVVSGQADGETVTVTLTYSGKTYGGEVYSSAEVPVKAGAYKVKPSISDGNYTFEEATYDFVVEKQSVEKPSLEADDLIYNGIEQKAKLAESDRYGITGNANTAANADGAFYTATVTLNETANYKWSGDADTAVSEELKYQWRIAKANLTDVSEGYAQKYDGKAHGITVSAMGFVGGDAFANLASVSYGTSEAYENGAQPITKKDVTNGAVTVYYRAEFDNYNTIVGYKTVTITPAELSVEWTNPESLVYDGKQKEVGYRLTADTAASTDITVTVLYTGDKLTNGAAINAGDYEVKLSTENANFAFDIKTNIHTFTVIQRTLTIEGLVAENRSYDGTVQIVMKGGKLVGIAEGDEERVSAVIPTSGTTEDANVGNGKAVAFDAIVLTGEASGNYTLAVPTVSVNVAPYEVTVEWEYAKDGYIYDGTNRASEVTAKYVGFEGTISPSSVEVVKGGASVAFTDTGEYVFTANFAENANYTLREGSEELTLTIAPREIKLQANSAEKTYGEANPTLNWDYLEGSAQFVDGDGVVLQVETDASETSAVGSGYYTRIVPYANEKGNYTITYTDGVFTVMQREITVTVITKSSVYGQNQEKLEASVTSGEIVNDDTNVYALRCEVNSASAVGTYSISGETLNANYNITFENESEAYSIVAADLTEITVQGYEGTYDGAEHEAANGTPTAKAVNDQTVTWKYKTAADGVYTEEMPRFTNADEYTVYYEITAPNHNTAEGQFTVKIDRADYDMKGITFDGLTVEYDGQAHRPEVKGTLPTGKDGIQVSVSYDKTATNVSEGKVTVTATFATTSANYNVPTAMTATVEIAAKVVTIEWAEDNFTYNGLTQTPRLTGTSESTANVYSYVGKNGEKLIVTVAGGQIDAGNSLSAEATLTSVENGQSEVSNYTLTGNKTTYSIQKKEITIEWAEDNFAYNGLDQKANVTAQYEEVGGKKIALNVTLTEEGAFKDYKEAGYNFTAAFANGETNYKLPSETAKTYHVKKATLTVTVSAPAELEYGDEFVVPSVESYLGFLGEDDESVLGGTLAIKCDYTRGSDVGEYEIVAEGFVSGNYEIVYKTSPLKVVARTVNAIWTDRIFVYDGTDQKDNVTASYLDADGTKIDLSVSGDAFVNYNADGYLFTANFHALDEGSKNYRINSETAAKRFMMQKRKVTVKANDATMYYSENPPTNIGWSYKDGTSETEKFVAADHVDFEVTTAATAESPVGKYVNTVQENPNLTNYEITYEEGVTEVLESLLKVKEDADLSFSAVDENGRLVPTEHTSYQPDQTVYVTNIAERQAVSILVALFMNEKDNLKVYNLKGDEVEDETANVGTGWRIELTGNGKIVDSVTVIVKGDLSGDGLLNSRDKSVLHRLIAEMGDELIEAQILAADINGDGKINSLDKAKLHRHIAELENIFETKQEASVAPVPIAVETEEPLFEEETMVAERLDETEAVTEIAAVATAEEEKEAQTESEAEADLQIEVTQEYKENDFIATTDVALKSAEAACGKSETEIAVLNVSEPKQSDIDFRITEIKKRRTSLSA